MSQIAPDIPELAHVPEVVRSLVWTRAMMRGIRSPSTWVVAAGCLAIFGWGGAVAGRGLLGGSGAVIGALCGCAAGVYGVLRIVVPWQSRRLVPVVEKEVDWTKEFGDVIRAQERVRAVAASANPRRPKNR